MDFDWTPAHDAFRERVRDFMRRNLPDDYFEKSRLDNSSPYAFEIAKVFCPALASEGLLVPHWPREVGGAGLDAFHHWILNEEMWAAGEPRGYQYMNVNWCGPTILQYGTPEQIAQFVKPIAAGTAFWCQGFSEPGAGSDLWAMRTRAEPVAGGFRINGSKIWTSNASFADHCFLLARTGEGRRAITVFLLPMRSPGIEVRVVPGIMGQRSFHEVFLTDVFVPESAVLGEVSQGVKPVSAVLHFERVGAPRYALTQHALDRAVALLQARGRFDNRDLRAKAARARAAGNAARLQALRVIHGRVKNDPPTAATNLVRYAQIWQDRLVCDFIGEYLPDVLTANSDPVIVAAYKRTASTGIAGGSAEILLNAVAKDYLALPKEG